MTVNNSTTSTIFFYSVHKGQTLKSILSLINPAIITSYFLYIYFDIIVSSKPKSLTWALPSEFPDENATFRQEMLHACSYLYVTCTVRDNAVGTATGFGLEDGWLGVRVPAGSRISFSTSSRPALGPTHPPIP
jgi:hypothetical protein